MDTTESQLIRTKIRQRIKEHTEWSLKSHCRSQIVLFAQHLIYISKSPSLISLCRAKLLFALNSFHSIVKGVVCCWHCLLLLYSLQVRTLCGHITKEEIFYIFYARYCAMLQHFKLYSAAIIYYMLCCFSFGISVGEQIKLIAHTC